MSEVSAEDAVCGTARMHGYFPYQRSQSFDGELEAGRATRIWVCPIVLLDTYPWRVGATGKFHINQAARTGGGARPEPDIGSFSHRAYGRRAGFGRLAQLFGELGISWNLAIDSTTVEECPEICEYVRTLQRGSSLEVLCGGVSAGDVLSSRLSEDEERRNIRAASESLQRAFGQPVSGWLGPEYGESRNSLKLLAEQGYRYVCDWGSDEIPIRLTDHPDTVLFPMTYEADDDVSQNQRSKGVDQYCEDIVESVSTIAGERRSTDVIVTPVLRAWLSGQPFRIHYLREMFRELAAIEGVEFRTCSDALDSWR